MNMFEQAVQEEIARRQSTYNVHRTIRESRAELVAKLHEAARPSIPDLLRCKLLGDYTSEVPFTEANPSKPQDKNILVPTGMSVRLGSKVRTETLVLEVCAGEALPSGGISLPHAVLRIERKHPYKTALLKEFEPSAEVETIVRSFFEALAPYLHIDQHPASMPDPK